MKSLKKLFLFSILTVTFFSQNAFASNTEIKVCELIGGIASSTEELSARSFDAKKRITSLETTLDQEAKKRETLIAQLKSVFQLKKTDKLVISDMRKILYKAKGYYLEIDNTNIKTEEFIESINDCEIISATTTEKVIETSENLNSLIIDEEKYRKSLTQSLKEKFSIITKEIEKSSKKDIEEK